jgi:hypothetical protein
VLPLPASLSPPRRSSCKDSVSILPPIVESVEDQTCIPPIRVPVQRPPRSRAMSLPIQLLPKGAKPQHKTVTFLIEQSRIFTPDEPRQAPVRPKRRASVSPLLVQHSATPTLPRRRAMSYSFERRGRSMSLSYGTQSGSLLCEWSPTNGTSSVPKPSQETPEPSQETSEPSQETSETPEPSQETPEPPQ